MKQGRRLLSAWSLVACMTGAGWIGAATGVPVAHAAAKSQASRAATSAKGPATRQFSGWVTAFDKSSLTVEKRGKQPRTIVFSKHPEMKTTGDVEKDARVTVYYRDEDGQMTAHRVVVKPAGSRGKAAETRERSSRSGAAPRGSR